MGAMNDLFNTVDDTLTTVSLASATDLAGFRRHARRLLAAHVAPAQVSWHCRDAPTLDLFANGSLEDQTESATDANLTPPPSLVTVPADFLALCQTVILHSDPQRFGLLYRLLWRLVHEPGLRHDPLDADRVEAARLAHAVRRDMHKMKAFVRFRPLEDEIFRSQPLDGPLHVAWFEPQHHIVAAITPFFVRRFSQMRWAILTPECSVHWDGSRAQFGPGAHRDEAPPADAGEQLWLTYYQHIFNPARLKLKMMQKEMPRRYWHNLPEAQFISTLSASAAERQAQMIDSQPSTPYRRIPIAPVSAHVLARGQPALTRHEPFTLATLKDAAEACRSCPIGQHATQAVCGEGPVHPRLMVVGEQPGDQEDLQGRPFVGPAGQLFDQALAQLGYSRTDLFITNAVKHFKFEPRGRRRMHKSPSQHEAAACLQWLDHEISLVKPGALLALGATAAASLLGRHVAVMSERGQWFTRFDGLRVLVTLHPAALLRMPAHDYEAAYSRWLQDLRLALNDPVTAR